jgi:UDP-N-acetylmuramoylalanine--D-glutamate ligase
VIDLSCFRGQTMAVMGLGRSGMTAALALRESGVASHVWDDSANRRAEAEQSGLSLLDPADTAWDGIDALVLSPGIPHTFPKPHPAATAARAAGCRIISDIELLARARPDARYVGVTGTNGKSTTTSLIGHLLTRAGRTVAVGGNLGEPVLALDTLDNDGIYVLELSSYQLEITDPLPYAVAILLNFSADHLDRHGGMDGYVAAKKRIFEGQTDAQIAIVGSDDETSANLAETLRNETRLRVVPISGSRRVTDGVYAIDRVLYDNLDGGDRPALSLDEVETLPGEHNAQNACAAYATVRLVGVPDDAIIDGFRSYPGLAHRQELVATIDGVRYVNDSKATNAEATARALSCYRNVYWIAGGQAKEGGIDELIPLLDHVQHAYLIGEAAGSFAQTLADRIPATITGDLAGAIAQAHDQARREAHPDATVLLSPACASFDQFTDFEARGDAFREAVLALPGTVRRLPGARETAS